MSEYYLKLLDSASVEEQPLERFGLADRADYSFQNVENGVFPHDLSQVTPQSLHHLFSGMQSKYLEQTSSYIAEHLIQTPYFHFFFKDYINLKNLSNP